VGLPVRDQQGQEDSAEEYDPGEQVEDRTVHAVILHPVLPSKRRIGGGPNDADRDAIASRLMRYRDQNGQRGADVIDFLTMWPDARRSVVRVLGELQAASD
jgi:hypothetical protein